MRAPTIVVTGAGSGGHITPLLAVTAELKRQAPKAHLIYIGQTGDSLGDIAAADPNVEATYVVRAGKFRRYHGEGWQQFLNPVTFFKNARDSVYVLTGIMQSLVLLRRLRPDAILIKGGFVGVPVGLAAATLGMPYLTHDSDAVPGLANRVIGRWAALHAVALPREIYHYTAAKTVTTGIPLQKDYVPVTQALKKSYRQEIGVPTDATLLFVSGGGLGSQRINLAMADIVPHLLQDIPKLYVVQSVGRAHEAAINKQYDDQLTAALRTRIMVHGYLSESYRYSGAADLIVARAGATTLAEFAVQGKACIVIPAPFLTGGQQLKNAEILASKQAVVILPETDLLADPNRLATQIIALIQDEQRLKSLADNLSQFAEPKAAEHLAKLLLELARHEAEA